MLPPLPLFRSLLSELREELELEDSRLEELSELDELLFDSLFEEELEEELELEELLLDSLFEELEEELLLLEELLLELVLLTDIGLSPELSVWLEAFAPALHAECLERFLADLKYVRAIMNFL